MEEPLNFDDKFKQAAEQSKIHRQRKSALFTFGATRLPYYFVAPSAINEGDTVIRKGEISTEKPALITGDNLPHFSGFGEDYDAHERQMSVIFGRGFHFPQLNYQNHSGSLEVVSKEEQKVLDELLQALDNEHDSLTAVVSGPEDSWALSILFYAGEMTRQSAPGNVKEMFERGRFNQDGFPGFGL
ncbi:MAG: hypothetical protein HQL32_13650 [Planctomycetes bacterium]|nr:hypothetical protein [Planctomycetota bacterium]